MQPDKRSRKWQITINNPENHGWTDERILETLHEFKGIQYYCFAHEIGTEEETPHVHIFMYIPATAKWGTVQKRFAPGHIEICNGTCQVNKDYVFKQGKHAKTAKADGNRVDTHVEWGQMPPERTGEKNDSHADFVEMIKCDATTVELLNQRPQDYGNVDKIERLKFKLLEEKYGDIDRDVKVTYVYGVPRAGKTSGVRNKYGGWKNICRIKVYQNPMKFDAYKGQDVLVLDEFTGKIDIDLMNSIMEGYPLELPARYHDRQAGYTKLYIISNIPLDKQYEHVRNSLDEDRRVLWQAFMMRIHEIIEYTAPGVFTVRPGLAADKTLGECGVVTFTEDLLPFDV
jgi:hypothetical protein